MIAAHDGEYMAEAIVEKSGEKLFSWILYVSIIKF